MASKDKKRAHLRHAPAGSDPRREVERLLEKGRYKDAVKEAKLCYRQEGTEASQRLLERAYFLRARQVHQGGMPTSAQEVARHLLDFGVTDPELTRELPPLLLAVGLSAEALAW